MSNSDYNKIISTINSVSRDYTYSPDPNNLICIDTSNNRIGINTLDPQESLHISGGNIIVKTIKAERIFYDYIYANQGNNSVVGESTISVSSVAATASITAPLVSATEAVAAPLVSATTIRATNNIDISRGRIIANNIDISSILDISRGRIIANNIDVSSTLDISRGRISANFIDVSSVLDISRGRIITNFIDVISSITSPLVTTPSITTTNIGVSSTLDISRGRIIANNIDASAINTKTIDVSNINIVDDFNMSTRPGSGGIITTSGDYIIHTFLASGSFIPPKFVEYVEALIVGGGGGGDNGYSSGSFAYTGGGGGGGGGGGVVRLFYSPISQSTIPYTVTVGSGGSGSTLQIRGSNGGDSIFNGATARGGGLGAGWRTSDSGGRGSDGGSGGGGYYGAPYPGLSTGSTIGIDNSGTYFGNNGVVAGLNLGIRYSGGGGGAQSSGYLYQGGDGIDDNILGVNYKWGGGGGGVNYDVNASAPSGGGGGGNGGEGQGGVGSTNNGGGGGINSGGVGAQNGGFGGANTGGGGGGGRLSATGGNGGSGIVVIRYRTTNSFNTINSTVINGIFYYINYILPRLPSPIVSIIIPDGSGNDPGLVIPIDMVNNDSVEINLKFEFTGTNNGNELYISYKSLGENKEFRHNLSSHTSYAANNNSTIEYYNDGRVTFAPEVGLTSVFSITIYRAIGNLFTTYLMSGNGVYYRTNHGLTRVTFSSSTTPPSDISLPMPDAIHLTWGSNYAMNARYTITNTPG